MKHTIQLQDEDSVDLVLPDGRTVNIEYFLPDEHALPELDIMLPCDMMANCYGEGLVPAGEALTVRQIIIPVEEEVNNMTIPICTATNEEIEAELAKDFYPLMEKYGAKVISKKFDVFYEFITIEFQGETLALTCGQVFHRQSLEFFLKHIDGLRNCLNSLLHITSPFYSDINLHLEAEFGKRAIANKLPIPFKWLCEKLKAQGRRIWS